MAAYGWDDDFHQASWRNSTSFTSDDEDEDVDESCENELVFHPLATAEMNLPANDKNDGDIGPLPAWRSSRARLSIIDELKDQSSPVHKLQTVDAKREYCVLL